MKVVTTTDKMPYEEEVRKMLNKVSDFRSDAFINPLNELILIPKTNLYFCLKDVKTELDFKCKVLEWCSRDCIKGVTKNWQEETSNLVNHILDTNFTKEQLEAIYCRLGNCVNHDLTIKFIQSNYDLSLLKRDHCDKCRGKCYEQKAD